jgi:hypothetical protein
MAAQASTPTPPVEEPKIVVQEPPKQEQPLEAPKPAIEAETSKIELEFPDDSIISKA